MPWLEVHGNDLYHVEDGDPSAPPLVFLHGNSSCGEAWWQQFDAFRDRFHVFAYDSVNHGHSSNSPRDAEETDRADELEGFLGTLRIERPVLAGNSMGGNTLIRWATRHPAEARGLIPSGSGVRPAGQGMPASREPLDPDTLFLPIGDALTDGFKQAHPRMHERYLRIRSTATRLEALRHPRQPAARTVAERETLADRVGAIESPMHVVVGSLDGAEPAARRLHELVPHSSLEVIEGAPHNVYYEAAEPYNATVGTFLEQLVAVATGVAGD